MKLPKYLRTDERQDTINALQHAARVLKDVHARPLDWKWVIVSIHNALQGALVCTMSGSAGLGALSEKSMKRMMEWLEESRSNPTTVYPDEFLAWPLELYERAKDARYMNEFGGAPISTTSTQDEDVRRLNDLRRGFVHFTRKSWSIQTAGLPRIISNAVEVIETLLLSHPANALRLTSKQKAQIGAALKAIRSRIR